MLLLPLIYITNIWKCQPVILNFILENFQWKCCKLNPTKSLNSFNDVIFLHQLWLSGDSCLSFRNKQNSWKTYNVQNVKVKLMKLDWKWIWMPNDRTEKICILILMAHAEKSSFRFFCVNFLGIWKQNKLLIGGKM